MQRRGDESALRLRQAHNDQQGPKKRVNDAIDDKPGEPWPDGEGPLRSEASGAGDDTLIVDVAGFEGPLDLLLELARRHKIDLAQISLLALTDQYLAYIERARSMRLELAADYLVMAAWLAYLKSRLLIPRQPEEEQPAEDLGAMLAFRLQRLQAMRDAAAKLMAGNVLGRDVFQRGAPEPLVVETQREYADNLIDLLKAYAVRRQSRVRHQHYVPRRLPTWSIKEARISLERLVGVIREWTSFDSFLMQYMAQPGMQRTVRASSFTASLELAREGLIELRQEQPFQPIYFRQRTALAAEA
jgi:segregation and condensation protein A